MFVVTADRSGGPHVAVADELEAAPENRLAVAEWYCRTTIDNLEQNRTVALVAWDPETDDGFQVVGQVERSEEVAMQDGEAADLESPRAFPQARRKLLITVNRTLKFVRGRHRDQPC